MKTKLLSLMGAAALVMSTGAQAYVIDLFTDPDGDPGPDNRQLVSDNEDGGDYNTDPAQFSQTGPYTSVLGGYRDIMVNAVSGAEYDAGQAPAACDTGESCSTLRVQDGRLTFDNDTGIESEAEVQWDGNDNSATFDRDGLQVDGQGVDFVNQEGCPDGGCDRLQFEVFEADQGFIFTVGIYTDDDTFTEFDLISSGDLGVQQLLFSDFQIAALCGLTGVSESIAAVRCGGSGTIADPWSLVDFTNVGGMRIAFTSQGTDSIAIDLEIGAITKTGVPEPGVLALLGIGLAAGAMARRRRIR